MLWYSCHVLTLSELTELSVGSTRYVMLINHDINAVRKQIVNLPISVQLNLMIVIDSALGTHEM